MANENDSFITLHRRITQWEWYTDMKTKSLFIHLLLLANHKASNWRGEVIERGQVLTGRMQLAQALGMSEQEIRTALGKLKSTNEITIRSTKKYSVITLNKYGSYQDKKEPKQPSKQPITQPAINREITTSNNVNNGNKEDKSKGTASVPNPGFSDNFMATVWPYFAKNKKGPYKNTSTQGVAVRTLFEMSGRNEEVAIKALKDTVTNNYQGFTWYFDRQPNKGNNGTNGTGTTKADHAALDAELNARMYGT